MEPILSSNDVEDESLGATIAKQLQNQSYVCLVCTENVLPTAKIWSCTHCCRVFDLDCVQDWAQTDSVSGDGTWRCPACNFSHRKIPKSYRCWCGRVPNPGPNPLDLHSCGYICGAQLKDRNCHHGCSKVCHPGPHISKCLQQGPEISCHCGKHEKQSLCSMTQYKRGWSCGDVCEDRLGCGIHKCQKRCHKGICGECKKSIKSSCYCGNIKEGSIKCSDRNPFKSTLKSGDSWIGNFQCDKSCEGMLSCGNHKCKLLCHPQTPNNHQCPLSPTAISTCLCGKTPLSKLNIKRTSCLDLVPTCDQICGKTLPCGHKCYWKCHDGQCAPCYESVNITCECGSSNSTVICGLNQQGYKAHCKLKCNVLKSCRRHNCKTKCCPERSIGIKRETETKKKIRRNELNPQNAALIPVEASHICVETCEKLLPCRKHYCQAICHSGPCAPCLQSEFEDLVCNCGNTILHAPFRCGTKLQPCEHPCVREKDCGHAQEPHQCHPDEIACPPCRQLTIKSCRCEKHNLIANVICSQDPMKISCMTKCCKPSPCGIENHVCTRECHLPGNCQPECLKVCGGTRACGHSCKELCHAENGKANPCPEEIKCNELFDLKCECGEKKMVVECWVVDQLRKKQAIDRNLEKEILREQALNNMECENSLTDINPDQSNVKEQKEEIVGVDQGLQKLEIDIMNSENAFVKQETLTEPETEQSSSTENTEADINSVYLPCSDKCRQQHRSRLMFEALQLSKSHKSSTTFDYERVEEIYTPFVLAIMKKQPTWCLSIESIFRSLTIGKVIRSWGIDYKETPNASLNTSPVPESRSNSNLSAGAKLLLAKKNQPKSILDSLTSSMPSYHFKPMKPIQRKFILELAQGWKLNAEEQDAEPKRSVFIRVVKGSVIPDIGLSDAVEIAMEYEEIKRIEEEEAKVAAEALRVKKEEEALEAKRLLEEANQYILEEEDKVIEEPKYWNAILIKETKPEFTLEEVENGLKSVYRGSDLSSIESQLAIISDNLWVLMFELGPQHEYKNAKVLLAQKILQVCPKIESKVLETGWGNECLVAVIEDGIVSEIGDWNTYFEVTNNLPAVIDIEIDTEPNSEDEEVNEEPSQIKWWS